MKEKRTRVIMALTGVTICGFSVGLFQASAFGMDPFQCFVHGLFNRISINFGTLYMCVNLLLLLLIFLTDRHYIGIATLMNIFLLGYIVDFTARGLDILLPQKTLGVRVLLLAAGILILCFSSSLYYTADLGVSAYDAIALILTDKKIARFAICRVGCDLFCVLCGFLLKAVIGIGTVITAFFMGPLIEWFNVHFSRPFLEKHS